MRVNVARYRRPLSGFPGLQLTRVGVWTVLFTALIALAATNTGNNALYMVFAALLALLVLAGLSARINLARLVVEVEAPAEVFANRPCSLLLKGRNQSYLLPSWLVQVSVDSSPGVLLAHLPRRSLTPRSPVEVTCELLLSRRGVHRLEWLHLSTLFPFGLMQATRRLPLRLEVLVYPEVFPAATNEPARQRRSGEESSLLRGFGFELWGLREMRPGDDPRGIHWKQTARTGGYIFQERQAEQSRRVAIMLDNATGTLDEEQRSRFERLVSEAATMALEFLGRGYEVELVTRDCTLPARAGRAQRRRILDALARLETLPIASSALSGSDGTPELRLALHPLDREAPRPEDGLAPEIGPGVAEVAG